MISKDRHQRGAVAAALAHAKKRGMQVVPDKKGHRWGWVICCTCGRDITVSGTPKNSGNEAKRITDFVDEHQH